jgi:hypothetical protein
LLWVRSDESHERYGTDGIFGFAAVATQLGLTPIELGRLDQGGVPLHVLGGQPVGLLFQTLVMLG